MKKAIAITLLISMVLSSVACGSGTTTSDAGNSQRTAEVDGGSAETDEKSAETTEKKKIGICMATAVNSWMAKEIELLEEECEKDTDKYEYTLSVGENAAQQQDIIETFLNGDYDLIMVMPQDAVALQEICDRVYDSGIPLIVATRPVVGDKYTSFIGGDDYQCGVLAAEYFGDVLNGEGKVVVMRNDAGTEGDLLRNGGFKDTLEEKYPNIEIISEADPAQNADKGYEYMTDMLSANEQIDGVYCQVDEVGIGVEQAIRNSGRTDCKYIVGVGGAQRIFDMMQEEDAIYTAISTFLPTAAQMALQYGKKYLEGEKIDKQIMDPSVLVTKENVDQYYNLGF